MVFVISVDFGFFGKDHVAVLREGSEFVLAGIDHHGGEPVHLLGDGVRDVGAVGDAAGEDDDIHLAVHHGALRHDVLGDVQHEGLHEHDIFFPAFLGTLDYLPHVIGAEIGHRATPADEFLLDLLFGVFPAEAHVNQRIRRAAARPFGRDGAVAAQAVGRVDHPAATVQGDGDAAAHVADDGCRVLRLAAGIPEVTAHDGAGVERMEQGPAGELWDAAHVALGQHFVSHRRVRHVGDAGAEGGLQAFLFPQGVDIVGDVVADQGAQVAGVIAFPARGKDFAHVGIHIIDTRDTRGEQAAAAHHDVDVLQADTLLPEGADDGVRAHLVLVHHVGEAGQFLDGMLQFLFEDAGTVPVNSEFRGDGTRVHDEDGTFLFFLVSGHHSSVAKCYHVVGNRFHILL